ncbi:MAG: hypothetical protein SPF91_13100 [Clostridium sp.]|nr:hypothetical protein [Clostridium sp.]
MAGNAGEITAETAAEMAAEEQERNFWNFGGIFAIMKERLLDKILSISDEKL